MNPATLTTGLLAYAGTLLVTQFLLVQSLTISTGTLGVLAAGIICLFFAARRASRPGDEVGPDAIGLRTIGLAAICLVLTGITGGLALLVLE